MPDCGIRGGICCESSRCREEGSSEFLITSAGEHLVEMMALRSEEKFLQAFTSAIEEKRNERVGGRRGAKDFPDQGVSPSSSFSFLFFSFFLFLLWFPVLKLRRVFHDFRERKRCKGAFASGASNAINV